VGSLDGESQIQSAGVFESSWCEGLVRLAADADAAPGSALARVGTNARSPCAGNHNGARIRCTHPHPEGPSALEGV